MNNEEDHLREYDTFIIQYFSQEFNEYMFPKTIAYHNNIIQQYLDKKAGYDYNKYSNNYINKNINEVNEVIKDIKHDKL